MKKNVTDTAGALAYVIDCTLATVCNLASKKAPRKHELERQINIAQAGIDWMDRFGVDYSHTRAVEAKELGGVSAWADSFKPAPVLQDQR